MQGRGALAHSYRGRGSGINPSGRFESLDRESFDDGWQGLDGLLEDAGPAVQTEIARETVKSILSRNRSPDIPFEQSINPYRGCEHGCIYCYARPSHSYVGLSAGLDFETKIFAKTNAPEILEKELRSPRYQPRVIALGANTDPYQPAERRHKITRGILEVLWEHRHPVSVITKNPLVTRDIDLLAQLSEKRLARVFVSITSMDLRLAGRIEPRAGSPHRRLDAVRKLREAGISVGVMAAPMIPGLNDQELETILEAAAGAGAESAGYVMLRLPHEVKDLFRDWLDRFYPERKDRVLHLVRSIRDGRENDARFGSRMRGTGLHAELMQKRFVAATRRLGLNRNDWEFNREDFLHRPEAGRQMDLF